jgi:hypothetical protein
MKEMKNNGCNGKCYLSKQLKKAAEKEKESSTNNTEKQELVYTQTALEFNFSPFVSIENKKMVISHYCEKPKSIVSAVFRPPLV